ncbi:hypothetical protein MRGA327_13650 [Mycobacterium tuberculosis RGTB327]|nr:hypothetical protein MRGA327_13650 [Mycobacterium tuberculosis RGTB327]
MVSAGHSRRGFAQADRQDAAHRQRRHRQPVHLVTGAGGVQRSQARLDFGNRVGAQEGLGRGNDRAGPILFAGRDDRHDQHRSADTTFRHRGRDGDGGG